MSLQQPQSDPNYYMDSSTSSHMAYNQGSLFSLTPCLKSKSIMVHNGVVPLVNYIGHSFFPFQNSSLPLKNILVSNQMVKNLVYVCQFTTDNSVSVEFDPFGFSVKDLKTGSLLHCIDITGDLYPVLPSTSSSSSAVALAAISSHTWHRRLGHPGISIFDFLISRKFISCSSKTLSLCHTCQLGKHCHLPFSHSNTKTSRLFELIHSDL